MLYLLVLLASLAPLALGALLYIGAERIRTARAASTALESAHTAQASAAHWKLKPTAARALEVDILALSFLHKLEESYTAAELRSSARKRAERVSS